VFTEVEPTDLLIDLKVFIVCLYRDCSAMARWILSLQPNSTLSTTEVVFNNINSLMQDLSLGANSSLIQSFGINAIASQLMSTLVPGMDFGPLVNQFSSSIINALLADIALGQNSTFAQSFTASLSALLTDIRGRYFFDVLPCLYSHASRQTMLII